MIHRMRGAAGAASFALAHGRMSGQIRLRIDWAGGLARWADPLEAGWIITGLQMFAREHGGQWHSGGKHGNHWMQIDFPGCEDASRPSDGNDLRDVDAGMMKQLLLRSQEGDRAAYRALLAACAARTEACARARGLSAAVTTQAVQGALALTHRALRTFRPDQSFATWHADIVEHAVKHAGGEKQGPGHHFHV